MNFREICRITGIDYYKSNEIRNGKKQCSMCKDLKLLIDFCKNRKYKDGYHPWCKECTIKINQDRKIQEHFARPKWFSDEDNKQLEKLEKEAKELARKTNVPYSICHKEPIQHWLVCGLDIPDNMFVDTQENNIKFSNWFYPYRISFEGIIEGLDIPIEFIVDAFNYNQRFNDRRNQKYKEKHA